MTSLIPIGAYYVAVAALVVIGLVLTAKPKRKPAHIEEGQQRFLQSLETIKETIQLCQDDEQLAAMEVQVDEFYYNSVDTVSLDRLKACMKILDGTIANQRMKIKRK